MKANGSEIRILWSEIQWWANYITQKTNHRRIEITSGGNSPKDIEDDEEGEFELYD